MNLNTCKQCKMYLYFLNKNQDKKENRTYFVNTYNNLVLIIIIQKNVNFSYSTLMFLFSYLTYTLILLISDFSIFYV